MRTIFLIVLSAVSAATIAAPKPSLLSSVGILKATDGAYQTESNELRARQDGAGGKKIEVAFTYNGYSDTIKKLGSGIVRHQFGIWVNAENQCNLIYAMVRVDKAPVVSVQQKFNPGKSTHEGCKNNGYRTLKPSLTNVLPIKTLPVGSTVKLRGEITDNRFSVFIDDILVWRGDVEVSKDPAAYAGVRSDNVKLGIQMLTH